MVIRAVQSPSAACFHLISSDDGSLLFASTLLIHYWPFGRHDLFHKRAMSSKRAVFNLLGYMSSELQTIWLGHQQKSINMEENVYQRESCSELWGLPWVLPTEQSIPSALDLLHSCFRGWTAVAAHQTPADFGLVESSVNLAYTCRITSVNWGPHWAIGFGSGTDWDKVLSQKVTVSFLCQTDRLPWPGQLHSCLHRFHLTRAFSLDAIGSKSTNPTIRLLGSYLYLAISDGWHGQNSKPF